jgi:uncharacterized protein YgiM (DUF1202 family)
MRGRLFLVGLVIAVGAGLVGADTTRWVERSKVDVRAGRGSFHEIVDTVVKGEKVEVIGTEARWQNVRTPRNRRGWIFEAALSEKQVSPGGSDFLKLAPGDASTSATSATAAAKGIYAQGYAQERGYDYGVVTWIEANQPPADEVERFVREGGLRTPGDAR